MDDDLTVGGDPGAEPPAAPTPAVAAVAVAAVAAVAVAEVDIEETDVAESDVAETDIEAIDARLDEVEQALRRIDAGTYGQCDACGSPIDDARLAELPTARQCAVCIS